MFKFVSKIFVIFCVATLSFGAPVEQDDYEDEVKEGVQVLDGAFQMHNEELSAFKYELSDGNMREETIKTDDLDNGIAVRGSYTIDLGGGEMQTIYYISDVNGHRISINKPFPEEELNKPRIAPNWQENEKLERLAQGRSIDFEGKSADRSAAAQRVSSEGDESAGVQRRASEANGSAAAQRLTPGASSSAVNQKGKLGAGLLLGAKKAGQKGVSTADATEANDSDAEEEATAQKAAAGANGSAAAAQRHASLGGASAANQKGKLGAGSLLGAKKATPGAGQKGADETETDDSDADEEATTQKTSAAAQRLASLRGGASAGQRFSSGPGYSIESSHKGGAGSLFKGKKTTTDAASLVVSQRPTPAPIENKDRFTQPPKATPTRVSSVRERPRVASLPDRPKNIEFHKDDDNDNDDAEKEEKEDEEKVADDEVKSDESEVPEEKKDE